MPAIIMEAALAIAILASASAIMSYAFSSSALPYRVSLSMDNEIYDLYSALLYNSTYRSCLLAPDGGCVAGMLRRFNSFYGASYASFSYMNRTFSYGSRASCNSYKEFCLPLGNGSAMGMSCLTLCG